MSDRHVDLDLEREVLGWLLWTGDLASLRGAGVTTTTFFRRTHQWIWAAAEAVEAESGVPSSSTVGAVLRARGQWEEVGGAYLLRLSDGAVAGAMGWQVTRLLQLAQAREAERALAAMRASLADPDTLVDGTLDTHLDLLTGIVGRRATASVLTPAAQWLALVTEAQRDTSRRVTLGLPAIDAVIGGIRPGEVCGLMARPGTGKTVTVCHVVTGLAKAGRSVCVFSLEMPGAQIIAKLAGMAYGEREGRVWASAREGWRSATDWAALMPHLVVVDTPSLSVADMQATIRALPTPPELVVIDYLGMIGGDTKLTTYDRVSKQARELKDLAKRCDTGVLLLIQVSREAGGLYGEKALSLGSARDSGVVEEALDYLLAVRRLDRVPTLTETERAEQENVIWFSLVKNRHGRVPHEEWAYAMDRTDLHLVEQADPVMPASLATANLVDMRSRMGGRR